jgi:hypothetical protein
MISMAIHTGFGKLCYPQVQKCELCINGSAVHLSLEFTCKAHFLYGELEQYYVSMSCSGVFTYRGDKCSKSKEGMSCMSF